MKIGIIVYSQTGNTLSVVNTLYDRLKKDNLDVCLEQIKAERNMKADSRKFCLTFTPNVDKYDVVIFASYIEAFSLCPVMKKYLESLKSLNGRHVVSFVTQYFPYPFLGGNNGIRKIKSIILEKNGNIDKTYVVNWSSKKRQKQIDDLTIDIHKYLKNQDN